MILVHMIFYSLLKKKKKNYNKLFSLISHLNIALSYAIKSRAMGIKKFNYFITK